MHKAERRAALVGRVVGCLQPGEEVADDRAGDRRGDPALPLGDAAHESRERLAVHILHHDEELALGGKDVESGHDLRVVHSGREARLVDEHRNELGVAGEVRVHPLDGHGAGEVSGPG